MVLFDHPRSVCMTYLEHCKFSLGLSFHFFKAGIYAIVHAFIPDICVDSSSNTIQYVDKRLRESGCKD